MTKKTNFLFSSGDITAFWALFSDNLANAMILTGVLLGLFKMPANIVFGRVLPGLAVSLVAGLLFYVYLARKLSKKEGRTDVTALPYGISTPVMFVYLFGVIGPVYWATNNPVLAWQTGMAAAFIGGIIEALGSVFGPFIKKITPRAAMLGTLAGISLTWIATVPLAEIFEHPMIGFPCLAIIIVCLIGGKKLPLNIPAGLAAIILGSLIGLATGVAKLNFTGLDIQIPVPVLSDLFAGLKHIMSSPGVLAVVLPIEIYNFIETMNNVESAEAAGDSYNVRSCQIMDGLGTISGTIFGSTFPTTVFIGHPAYKKLGAKSGYALGVGVVFASAAILGLFQPLQQLIPVAAVAPILVFIGLIITAQAFTASPTAHAPAVAIALIPHVSDLVFKKMTAAVSTMGSFINNILITQAPKTTAAIATSIDQIKNMSGPYPITDTQKAALASEMLKVQGIHISGHAYLSKGAIISGLIWGAILACSIDKKSGKAALFALAGAIFSLFGVIHSDNLGFFPQSPIFIGYLLVSILIYVISLKKDENKSDSDMLPVKDDSNMLPEKNNSNMQPILKSDKNITL